MTETRKFDEQTHWDHDPGGLRAGGAGWAPPGSGPHRSRRPVLGSRTGQGANGLRRPEHTLQHRQRGATAPPRIRRRNGGTRRRITGLPRRRPPSDLPAQRRRNSVPDCRQRRTGATYHTCRVPPDRQRQLRTGRLLGTSSRAADSQSARCALRLPRRQRDADPQERPRRLLRRRSRDG